MNLDLTEMIVGIGAAVFVLVTLIAIAPEFGAQTPPTSIAALP
ncbi:putative membrane protein YhiD involved in acid resistance [Sinorhizobium terangae]|nr:hypothetical protein [Sinorhizobium terangae]MBB4184272.1 putative membrane protein YhiD involved in acid resistance [Sinorhizobium terangae]